MNDSNVNYRMLKKYYEIAHKKWNENKLIMFNAAYGKGKTTFVNNFFDNEVDLYTEELNKERIFITISEKNYLKIIVIKTSIMMKFINMFTFVIWKVKNIKCEN